MITNLDVTVKRRRKGDGSISQRCNGTYSGRITLPGHKPYICYAKTEREAEKKLKEYKERTLRGEIQVRKMMVADYIIDWMITFKKPVLKPSSYDRLERTFLYQIKDSNVGRCQMGNINARDVQNLIQEKQTILSYSSLKKVYELLNSCFKHAVVTREINYNPMQGVILPKQAALTIKTKEIQILSNDELKKIYSVVDRTFSNGQPVFLHAQAIVFILNTGLRSGEALCLKWTSINFEKRTVHITESVSTVKNRDIKSNNEKKQLNVIGTVKTLKGSRIIPLNDKALSALRWIQSYQELKNINTEYVISSITGKMVLHGSFQRSLDVLLHSANIKHIGLHALRHTFATNLLEHGVDIKTVSMLLGHSSVTITYNTYVHPSVGTAFNAVNVLDSIN